MEPDSWRRVIRCRCRVADWRTGRQLCPKVPRYLLLAVAVRRYIPRYLEAARDSRYFRTFDTRRRVVTN